MVAAGALCRTRCALSKTFSIVCMMTALDDAGSRGAANIAVISTSALRTNPATGAECPSAAEGRACVTVVAAVSDRRYASPAAMRSAPFGSPASSKELRGFATPLHNGCALSCADAWRVQTPLLRVN